MAAPNFWDNPDGLRVHFNRRNIENNIPGVVRTAGERVELVYTFRGEDLVDVPASANIDRRSAYIPAGALIESARIVVTEAFVGATAALDVGTHGLDDGAVVDDDGLFSGIAVATLVAGYTAAGAGAQIATRLAEAMYVIGSYDTAAFTAGCATIYVAYIPAPVQTI
jgi:hypothetical protein